MEAPSHIVEALKNVSPGMNLRWNPTARVLKTWGFDANGKPRGVEHDPRWELWDVDADGREYYVMTLEDPNGGFLPPGEWLVEMRRLLDPARYDGDLTKMIAALVDAPNAEVERLSEKAFEELCDSLAERYWGKTSSDRIQVAVPAVPMQRPLITNSRG